MKRYRLSIMLVVPFLFVLYFSTTALRDKFQLAGEMTVMQDLMTLTVRISQLIHELQRERGMTAGLLGSQGKQFKSEIVEQRVRTNQQVTGLQQLITQLNRQSFSEAFDQALQTAMRPLEHIDQKRKLINGLQIPVKDAIAYYSSLNAAFLALIADIIKQTGHGRLAIQAMAYLGFLQNKEKAGIERAILSNAFVRHEFAPGLFNQFVGIVAAQEVYTALFLALVAADQKTFYQQTMAGKFSEETARLRHIALAQDDAKIREVDAGHWFAMQTGKIELLKKVEDQLADRLISQAADLGAAAQRSLLLSLVITLAAFVITIAAMRAIKRPLREVVQTAHQIAGGNLTHALNNRFEDEIGQLLQAMQTMQASLRTAVSEVLAATRAANRTAAEIAQGSADLAQRTEEQAAALEETAASMEELTTTVQHSAAHAEQASQRVRTVLEQVERSGTITAAAAAAMAEIEQSNRKIAKIINVIDDFAFQTNLLALNAAVEAARAGEKGQGFAVVAAEVRKLAARSAESAQQIHRLVNDSIAKVSNGGQLVQESGAMLRGIVTAVQEAHVIVAEIAGAAREQAQGIEQINKAIMQMDQVTQQNAALVEETAAASQAMGEQAQALQQQMRFFQLGEDSRTIGGETPVSRTAVSPAPQSPSAPPAPARAAAGPAVKASGFIAWSDALSVGDPVIDQQHQKLVSIINQLHDAMATQSTQARLRTLLDELIAYTQEHFRYEEQRMQAANYPQLAKHRTLHAHLLQQVGAFHQKFQRGERINMELMKFLRDWLINHIQKSDKDYGPYLQRTPG